MIDDRRDRLIRAALSPHEHLVAPADLAAAIGTEIRLVPQVRRPWLGRITMIPRDARVRLVFVLGALLLAIAVAIGVASRLQSPPPSIGTYHGPPSRTGVMPGPAPRSEPIELWRTRLSGSVGVLGMPLVIDQTVLVADGGGVVTAVTEAGGTPVWKAAFDRPGAVSLVVIGNVVIAGSERGQLSAIGRANGAIAWTVPIGAGGMLQVAADGGVIVVASTDSHVYGVDPRNGHVIWDIGCAGEVSRGAAMQDGTGVVGDDGGRVTQFEVATGHVIHTWELGAGEITTPAIEGGVAYVAHGFADGSPAILVALDLANGRKRWGWTLPNAGRLFVGAVADPSVVALDDFGTAWKVDSATGSTTTLYRANGAFGSVGAVVGSELILTSTDGAIVAIDRTTGVPHWSARVEGVPSTPSVIDGRVFLATDRGDLIAFGDAPAAAP